MKLNDKRRRKPSWVESVSCEYCAEPERYNLNPARVEHLVRWHYERIAYCPSVPRSRVRCRKPVS
jgi:hypothetical protein